MMYDKSDPRAALAPAAAAAAPKTGLTAVPSEARFHRDAPQAEDASGKTWLIRGANFVLAWSELVPGGALSRTGQVDEYAVIFPAEGGSIAWGGETTAVPGWSCAFVPPGDSVVTMPGGGAVARLFTVKSTDLAEACPNAATYAAVPGHIPAFEPWPEPPAGWKVRAYPLSVPAEPGRFGCIYRCTTMMINGLDPLTGPRDTAKLSPHHHDDFEQLSLAVAGEYIHHLRWPWTVDLADWREDQAVRMGAPSALVIPPPVIHTSRGVDAGLNQLIDIFCPPRLDFSQKPGWVLNADDYPMPS